MRVEFELGNRLYAVRRVRHGELVAEVYIPPHTDTGYGFLKRKPECWRPLNPKRFPHAVRRVFAEARIRGLID